MTDDQRDAQKEQALKWAHAEFVSDVSAILYRYDPLGIGHPMPGNEYNGEAQRLVPRLAHCTNRSEVRTHAVGNFSESGPLANVNELVDELWWALDLFRSRSA